MNCTEVLLGLVVVHCLEVFLGLVVVHCTEVFLGLVAVPGFGVGSVAGRQRVYLVPVLQELEEEEQALEERRVVMDTPPDLDTVPGVLTALTKPKPVSLSPSLSLPISPYFSLSPSLTLSLSLSPSLIKYLFVHSFSLSLSLSLSLPPPPSPLFSLPPFLSPCLQSLSVCD